MGIQISNNKRTSSSSETVVYRLSDSKGNSVKVFEVPVESAEAFKTTVLSEKVKLETQLGTSLSLIEVKRVF